MLRRMHTASTPLYRTGALALVLLSCSRSPSGPAPQLESDVEQCIANLRAIHAGLVEYARTHDGLPQASGPRLLAALIAEGTWPNDAQHAHRLTCPGVDLQLLELGALPAEQWFTHLAEVGEQRSAYAARDLEAFPLERFPAPGIGKAGREVLAACDNHLGANHDGVTNVLLTDGSVITYELEREIQAGRLPATSDRIPIGSSAPDSLAELRKLRSH